MLSLKEKTLVITGAAGGIGKAVVELLDAAGVQMVLTDINHASLEALNQQLSQRHYTVTADLSTAAGRDSLLTLCRELMRPPQMLINIAGINQFAGLSDYSDQQLERLIHINLSSQIALCRDFLPLLQQQSEAWIVNVGSILGSIGMPGYSVYCASKFGLRGFSEALNRELMDSNVTVRYFAPRATLTELNDQRVNEMNKALGNAMDAPGKVALELVSFLKNTQKRAYLGWPEKLFVRINSLCPNLVDKSFGKQLPVIKKYL